MPESLLTIVPVIPVVVLDRVQDAVPLARALVAGGLPVAEITLRTPAALDAIRAIADEVPDILVGAGTVLSGRQAASAAAAGAKFLVSPGTTPDLLSATADTGLPYLPGTSSVSDVMRIVEAGLTEVKFFPAEAAGGAPFVKAMSDVLPHVGFCPTGGIRLATASSYLAIPQVGCVGGTWITPADAIERQDWQRITDLAREASLLGDLAALTR